MELIFTWENVSESDGVGLAQTKKNLGNFCQNRKAFAKIIMMKYLVRKRNVYSEQMLIDVV